MQAGVPARTVSANRQTRGLSPWWDHCTLRATHAIEILKAGCMSLVFSENSNGVHRGCATSRNPTGEGGSSGRHEGGSRDTERIRAVESGNETMEYAHQSQTEHEAGRKAKAYRHESLAKNKAMNVAGCCSESDANANFLRSTRCCEEGNSINACSCNDQSKDSSDSKQSHDESTDGNGIC